MTTAAGTNTGREPGPRGLAGAAGGRVGHVQAPTEIQATSVQVCGLWPFVVGSPSPTVGTPLGQNLRTGNTVCCDPVAWFSRASLIPNPSVATIGIPAVGKSTLMRRMVLGVAGQGVQPLVLGDLRPDYVDLIEALGGQVVRLGRGRDHINPLDVGALGAVLTQLPPDRAERLREEVHGRRLTMTLALIEILRREPVADYEELVLSQAIWLLDQAHHGQQAPLLGDLVQLIDHGPEDLRALTLARGCEDRYRAAVDPLVQSLLGLLENGPFGATFARPTSKPLDRDAPAVCVDMSAIGPSEHKLQAASMLTAWNDGFSAIDAAHALTDAGLGPQRHYYAVLDELWRVLRGGALVDRIDQITRLNRSQALGTGMVMHTLKDLRSMARPEDREKATGFVERAGMVICGGLPKQELDELANVVPFSQAERAEITKWSTPPTIDPRGRTRRMPGEGKFMIKVGQRPGIPVKVQLTSAERQPGLRDTNERWRSQ